MMTIEEAAVRVDTAVRAGEEAAAAEAQAVVLEHGTNPHVERVARAMGSTAGAEAMTGTLQRVFN